MASLPVFDRAGKEVGKYDIDPAAIAPNINKQLLHDVVVMYQANQRMGTHKTKTRSEVRGTTKKMYRQKGTGNARAGSKQAPQRRGGGHAFALRNRDYSYRLPKKAVQAATRMAIASKLNSQDVIVLDELSLSAPKTKDVAAILKALQLQGVSTHVATATLDPVVFKSVSKIDKVKI
jgi:large subunit ribosomal protein L4